VEEREREGTLGSRQDGRHTRGRDLVRVRVPGRPRVQVQGRCRVDAENEVQRRVLLDAGVERKGRTLAREPHEIAACDLERGDLARAALVSLGEEMLE